MTNFGDPLTLCERLQKAAATDNLSAEALARIQQLEQLCAMMTDTGVILEEDVQALVKADTWWSPGDSEYCYTNLTEAMRELAVPGQIMEWGRAHTLSNGYAVWREELRDADGRVVVSESFDEYESYGAAERAAADYSLRKRRVEYEL